MTRPITLLRRTVMAVWSSMIVLVMALVVTSHAAPALGYDLVIIKGPSMEPAIPIGSLAFERPILSTDLRPGMVVTFVLPNRIVVTHRITRVGDANGSTLIETKGDNNGAADPGMHPATGVTGLVHGHLPFAGYVLAFLSTPTGMLSGISMLGSMLVLLWLLDDLEDELDAEAEPLDAESNAPGAIEPSVLTPG